MVAQVEVVDGHQVRVDAGDVDELEAESMAATLELGRRCSVAEWVSS